MVLRRGDCELNRRHPRLEARRGPPGLIERLAYEGFDHRLAADVQLLGGAVQLFEHARRQVDIHPLDRTRPHHAPGIGEEP